MNFRRRLWQCLSVGVYSVGRELERWEVKVGWPRYDMHEGGECTSETKYQIFGKVIDSSG